MRIKRGLAKKKKHNRILSLTKGFRLSYSKLYKRAKEALLHAGQYSFAHRRKRGGDFRRLWIERINAALCQYDLRYSQFIDKLKKNNIELDRKVLADMALDEPDVFKAVVGELK